jgi:uncharacterized OsmC-like protein
MAADDVLVSRARSRSSGEPGRALNQARTNHFVIDSSHDPEAVSTIESFLAGVSACGVTLVERTAQERGIALKHVEVTIEGVRLASAANAFKEVNMRFELTGVSRAQADELLDAYQHG